MNDSRVIWPENLLESFSVEEVTHNLFVFISSNPVLLCEGARGLAHLGVIRAMHEHNIPIDCIGGTSQGTFSSILCFSADVGCYCRFFYGCDSCVVAHATEGRTACAFGRYFLLFVPIF